MIPQSQFLTTHDKCQHQQLHSNMQPFTSESEPIWPPLNPTAILLTYGNICCGQMRASASLSCLHVMCEMSLSDTVGEETLCAEMVGDRAFIPPTEGSLLLFLDLSWAQSERADKRLGLIIAWACTHTHTQMHTNRHLHIQNHYVSLSCQSYYRIFFWENPLIVCN